jgi:hypothetical protein
MTLVYAGRSYRTQIVPWQAEPNIHYSPDYIAPWEMSAQLFALCAVLHCQPQDNLISSTTRLQGPSHAMHAFIHFWVDFP